MDTITGKTGAPALDDLFGRIDGLRDDMVALTQELVRIPTVNPPGQFYDDCARLIGERLRGCEGVELDMDTLETNIIVFGLRAGAPDAATVVARAAEREVLVMAFGPRTVRAVTHLDVSRADCEHAADALAEAVA